jgi:hypothetical protein
MAALLLSGLIAGIDYQINHPESRLPPVEMFFGFAFIVLMNVFLILSAIGAARAGRLVIQSDKALLPRIALGPWWLLKPHELCYAQVERYGMGLVCWQGQPFFPVFVFALKPSGTAVRGKTLRLAMRWYDHAAFQAIMEEFVQRIGHGPESLENSWLGEIRFADPQRRQIGSPWMPGAGTATNGVCAICGARLGRRDAATGLCGSCRRKASGG